MKTVRHTVTLFFYDGPQVFEAHDDIGGHYIAVMIESPEGEESYLVAGVQPERLRQFRSGMIDLKTLISVRPDPEWFIGRPSGDMSQPLLLELQTSNLYDSRYLPEDGFVLYEHPTESEILREARERNNLVLELTVDPPEAVVEHRIRVNTLVGLLSNVQKIVKYAYGSALRGLSQAKRKSMLDTTDAHLLDVIVPAAAGSFKIVLEAARQPGLFGQQNELERALFTIDELFKDVKDPETTLNKLKQYRGHFAAAYIRLLSFLVENKTGMFLAWAEPDFPQPRKWGISEAEANPLLELLSGVANLSTETVTILGFLKKADVDSGTWRLEAEDGNYPGKTKSGGPSLAGLVLENKYRFTCIEEIDEIQGSGREQKSLYLIHFDQV